jgi:hypothetical protein
MRTTIIPAQITTVEDKIAGSLSLTQILILMVPVLFATMVYALLIPAMKLAPYKLVIISLVTLACGVLALRIRGKIIADWVKILLAYRLRPQFYLFNKNDATGRLIDVPDIPNIPVLAKKREAHPVEAQQPQLNLTDLIKLEHLIDTGKVAVSYSFEGKNS